MINYNYLNSLLKYTDNNGLISSLDNLSSNLSDVVEAFKNIGKFFAGVGRFFKGVVDILSHPNTFFLMIEPWIIVFLISLVVLKVIGFKTDKWLGLFLLLFILILIF